MMGDPGGLFPDYDSYILAGPESGKIDCPRCEKTKDDIFTCTICNWQFCYDCTTEEEWEFDACCKCFLTKYLNLRRDYRRVVKAFFGKGSTITV